MTKKGNSQASKNPPAAVKASDDSKAPATSSVKTRDLEPTQGTTGTANSSSTGGAATEAQPPQKRAENKADAQAANATTGVNPPASTPAAPVPSAAISLIDFAFGNPKALCALRLGSPARQLAQTWD